MYKYIIIYVLIILLLPTHRLTIGNGQIYNFFYKLHVVREKEGRGMGVFGLYLGWEWRHKDQNGAITKTCHVLYILPLSLFCIISSLLKGRDTSMPIKYIFSSYKGLKEIKANILLHQLDKGTCGIMMPLELRAPLQTGPSNIQMPDLKSSDFQSILYQKMPNPKLAWLQLDHGLG